MNILLQGLVVFSGVVVTAMAAEPIVTNIYTADPSARVVGERLYVYPSHDRDQAQWWDMEDWHVISTADMKEWTDHGVALAIKDISWAEKRAWAPDCIERDGKFYFYYPTDSSKVGVAVGDKPEGPFKDPLGHPLVSKDTPGVKANRDLIDPAVFIDDDGQAYLYFGQNIVNAVKLKKDMITLDGPIKQVAGADKFFEAIWMHKYNGKYYLSYSGGGNRILYAMGDSPLGPFNYKGEILGKVNSGTNHHSIVEFKGQWYLFYHTADLSRSRLAKDDPERKKARFRRSVCFAPLEYDDNGLIKPIKHEQTLPDHP